MGVHETLTQTRAAIDALDAEVAALLDKRAGLARRCRELKAPAPVYSAAREQEVLDAHRSRARVWEEVLRGSRAGMLAGAQPPAPAVLSGRFEVVAGPCSVEGEAHAHECAEAHAHECAEALAALGVRRMRGGCWKPRTSPFAFQGHGLAALRWMRAACDRHGLELWTEVRDVANLEHAGLIDVAWVGARNAQNFELLSAAGRACAKVVLKRGPWMTVDEWLSAAEYVRLGGAKVALCERGIKGSDPMLRSTLDLAGGVLARLMGGVEVLADPSHATGLSALVGPMVLAARAAGLSGALIEVHPRPLESVTDSQQALSFDDLEEVLLALA